MSDDGWSTEDEETDLGREIRIRIVLPSDGSEHLQGHNLCFPRPTTALLNPNETENLISQSMLRYLYPRNKAVAPEGSFQVLEWCAQMFSHCYTRQSFKVVARLDGSVVLGSAAYDILKKQWQSRQSQIGVVSMAVVSVAGETPSKNQKEEQKNKRGKDKDKRKKERKGKDVPKQLDPEAKQEREKEMRLLMAAWKIPDNNQSQQAGVAQSEEENVVQQ